MLPRRPRDDSPIDDEAWRERHADTLRQEDAAIAAAPILTKHAPLLGAGAALASGQDLYRRQRVALTEAQGVPGVGSADDVRQAVGAYLRRMVADETAAIPGPLSDLLALLADAEAIAFERAAAAGPGAAGTDWTTIANAIGGVASSTAAVEHRHPNPDPR